MSNEQAEKALDELFRENSLHMTDRNGRLYDTILAALSSPQGGREPAAGYSVKVGFEQRPSVVNTSDLLAAPPHGAEPAPLLREGWQPIETAPKIGRDLILLLTPSSFPQVAYSNTWWTAGFSVECKPTHWMRAALAELVALKDLKDEEARMRQRRECRRLSGNVDMRRKVDAMRDEYNRRKPLAWAAARSALSASTQPEGIVAARYRNGDGRWNYTDHNIDGIEADGWKQCQYLTLATPPDRAAPVFRPMHHEDGRQAWYLDHPDLYCDVEQDEAGKWSIFFKDRRAGHEAFGEFPDRAAASAEGPSEPIKQLMRFYAVTTLQELVEAQSRHVEKLQAKLPPTPSLGPTFPRG